MTIERAITKATSALLRAKARSATVYLSDKQTVRVSRRMYGRAGKRRFFTKAIDLVVTVGKPNYEARGFVRRAKRAGEPFPVARPQLSFPAAR
jgi:hypothetical protein